MITGADVLGMLCPLGGWIISGNDFENITWVDDRPRCTKAEFEAGFAQFEAYKIAQDAKNATDKAAILAKIGITADELRIALS